MSSNWNDDERDVRVSMYSYRPSERVEENQSVCAVLRDYFKDQKDSLYSWTLEDYNAELSKRLNQAVPPPPPLQCDEEVPPPVEEKQDQEEFNNEILDNQIYKKSMYS